MDEAGGASRDVQPVVTGKQVRHAELDLIAVRRRQAFPGSYEVKPHDVADNLVGLALSGGGNRSAAFSLGLLQVLYKKRLLRLIDYLSTVSGGGYAGAYLTSSALCRSRSSRPTSESNGAPAAGNPADLFPVSSDENGRESDRMVRFIHSGRYLAHWWQFFNRYIIGLILMLTVVISGLVTATSGIAWLFRCIDHQNARDWLWALNFKDDLAIAFFPSFLLLLLWAACWAASYYKRGSRATGQVALGVFCLLVLSTATAIAVLLGNGEISLTGLEAGWGLKPDDARVQSITGWIWTGILAGVGAALLPYLSPKRLLRSGTQGKSALERGVFWVATRALVFGVPFVMIAWFARENISHWNELRDDRITHVELESHPDESGGEWAPFWRHLQAEARLYDAEADLGYLFSQFLPSRWSRIRPSAQTLTPGAYLWRGGDVDDKYLEDRFSFCAESGSYLRGLEIRTGLLSQHPDVSPRWERSLIDPNHDLRFYERWGSLLALPWQWRFHDEYKESNRLYAMVEHRRDVRAVHREMMYIVNCRLLNPDFYTYFNVERLRTIYPGRSSEEWDQLEELSAEAKQLRFSVVGQENRGDEDVQGACKNCLSIVTPLTFTETIPRRLKPVAGRQINEIHALPASEHRQYWGSDGDDDSAVSREERRAIVDREQRDRAVLNMNRRLLECLYPDSFRSRSEVRSYIVLAKDQQVRLSWFLWAVGILLISSLLIDLNAISWHGYYACQVAKMWTEPVPGLRRDIPLGQLETAELGRPYHLITASLHLVGPNVKSADYPKRRNHFLFSHLYCGSDALGYRPTDDWMAGEYRLADAIAVSGGAVTPVENSNPLIACLLTLANVRMGQWVQNPRYISRVPRFQQVTFSFPFTPFRFLLQLFQNPADRPFVFVADGGHHENLGIEPLLKRRCRLIIASDAGMDHEYQFADLTRLMRWSRILHGIRFQTMDGRDVVSLDDIIPNEKRSGYSGSHYVILRIVYPGNMDCASQGNGRSQGEAPNGSIGHLVYLKSSLLGDEPIDLAHYSRHNDDFPHDSTADQFFDPERFESYRQLGEKIGTSLCGRLPASLQNFDSGSRESVRAFIDRFLASIIGSEPRVEAPERDAASSPVESVVSCTEEVSVQWTPDSVRPLLETLKSESTDSILRETAALDVARSGVVNQEIVIALLDAALCRNEFVRRSARHALEYMGRCGVPFLRDVGLTDTRAKCQSLAAGVIDAIYLECHSRRRRNAEVLHTDAAFDQRLMILLLKLFREGSSDDVRRSAGLAAEQYLVWIHSQLSQEQLAEMRKILASNHHKERPGVRSFAAVMTHRLEKLMAT